MKLANLEHPTLNQTNRTIRIRGSFTILMISFYCTVSSQTYAQTNEITVSQIDGLSIQGIIQEIDVDSISVKTATDPAKINFDQIQKIRTGFDPTAVVKDNIAIRLVDGTSLNANSFTVSDRELSAKLHCGLDCKFQTRNVTWIRFKTYENSLSLGKQWRGILEDDTIEGDAIVVNRSDELNTVEGIVGDFSEDKLGFSIGERTARVAVAKMDAILFYHAAGRELATPACEILLLDESRLKVRRMVWNNGKITATLVCGTESELSLDQISSINFSLGRDELLSEMEPTTNDWQALITSSAIMEKLRRLKLARKDESFSGAPLSLKVYPNDGETSLGEIKQFEHGFAMQGGGKLAFSLNGQYEKLSGLIGFDPLANISGHVKVVVLVDGKALVQEILIHRTMKNPINLDINIKDANRVVFQVDYQDGRSTGDQLHLVNLKVSQ